MSQQPVNSSMAAEWYVRQMGEIIGPLTFHQMRTMVGQAQMSPDDLVRSEASGEWVRADQVEGLFRKSTLSKAFAGIASGLVSFVFFIGLLILAMGRPRTENVTTEVALQTLAKRKDSSHSYVGQWRQDDSSQVVSLYRIYRNTDTYFFEDNTILPTNPQEPFSKTHELELVLDQGEQRFVWRSKWHKYLRRFSDEEYFVIDDDGCLLIRGSGSLDALLGDNDARRPPITFSGTISARDLTRPARDEFAPVGSALHGLPPDIDLTPRQRAELTSIVQEAARLLDEVRRAKREIDWRSTDPVETRRSISFLREFKPAQKSLSQRLTALALPFSYTRSALADAVFALSMPLSLDSTRHDHVSRTLQLLQAEAARHDHNSP